MTGRRRAVDGRPDWALQVLAALEDALVYGDHAGRLTDAESDLLNGLDCLVRARFGERDVQHRGVELVARGAAGVTR